MAKTPNKSKEAHIRLIVLDAVLPDGDIGQLAQAIQNAIRPATAHTSKPLPVLSPAPQQIEGTVEEQEQSADDEETSAAPKARPAAKNAKPRKISIPKAVELDGNAVASWLSFAASKSVKSEIDKYLVVAAWFHDHRSGEPITAGHVYACYRYMKWSVAIDDFGSHLRSAKNHQLMSSVGRGEYTITQLGLQKVAELEG